MLGLMQDYPLLVQTIIDHAAFNHGEREVVTRSIEGPIRRTNYFDLRSRALKVAKALEKEGKAILSNVRKGAAIVAMCIEGRQISSDELAQFLADRANSGAGDVAFVIGSSHGLSDEVKKAAALRFSMGRITMPHQLARLVLTEQIYRACTINAGMKYHK